MWLKVEALNLLMKEREIKTLGELHRLTGVSISELSRLIRQERPASTKTVAKFMSVFPHHSIEDLFLLLKESQKSLPKVETSHAG